MNILQIVICASIVMVISGPAFAAKGGQPAAHDLSGKDFGAAVSETAKSAPGSIGDHASGGNRNSH